MSASAHFANACRKTSKSRCADIADLYRCSAIGFDGLSDEDPTWYDPDMSINATLLEQTRVAIKDVCQRMEAGNVSFIEGTRQILTLASNAALKDDDPDLIVFQGIASETDEVPSPKVLELWNVDAATKHASIWGELECWAKNHGAEACRNLISRL